MFQIQKWWWISRSWAAISRNFLNMVPTESTVNEGKLLAAGFYFNYNISTIWDPEQNNFLTFLCHTSGLLHCRDVLWLKGHVCESAECFNSGGDYLPRPRHQPEAVSPVQIPLLALLVAFIPLNRLVWFEMLLPWGKECSVQYFPSSPHLFFQGFKKQPVLSFSPLVLLQLEQNSSTSSSLSPWAVSPTAASSPPPL